MRAWSLLPRGGLCGYTFLIPFCLLCSQLDGNGDGEPGVLMTAQTITSESLCTTTTTHITKVQTRKQALPVGSAVQPPSLRWFFIHRRWKAACRRRGSRSASSSPGTATSTTTRSVRRLDSDPFGQWLVLTWVMVKAVKSSLVEYKAETVDGWIRHVHHVAYIWNAIVF